MMKIAYFSPLNPVKSGISDYSEELLPYLARQATIDLFVDGYQPTNPEIAKNFRVFDVHQVNPLDLLPHYDVALYHMGNSLSSSYVYDTLVQWPGVVVLHDYCLHHFLAGKFIEGGEPNRYLEELSYCHGKEGLRLLENLDALMQWEEAAPLRYPMNKRVIDSALGVIVHSDFVRELLVQQSPTVPVKKVNHHVLPEWWQEVSTSERVAILQRYGHPFDAAIISSFGYISTKKRIDKVLHAIAALRPLLPVNYYLVGERLPGAEGIDELIVALGLKNGVGCPGFASPQIFRDLMAVSDVCVSLRYPTMGETSGSLCKQMAMGKACIVSNVGWYKELPDDCVAKIEVNDKEVENLTAALYELIINESLRLRIGENARAYIQAHHRVEDSAAGYVNFCAQVKGRLGTPELRAVAGECRHILDNLEVKEEALIHRAVEEAWHEIEELAVVSHGEDP